MKTIATLFTLTFLTAAPFVASAQTDSPTETVRETPVVRALLERFFAYTGYANETRLTGEATRDILLLGTLLMGGGIALVGESALRSAAYSLTSRRMMGRTEEMESLEMETQTSP